MCVNGIRKKVVTNVPNTLPMADAVWRFPITFPLTLSSRPSFINTVPTLLNSKLGIKYKIITPKVVPIIPVSDSK